MQTDQLSAASTSTILPSALRMGAVHYTVANLDRQTAFYHDVLGFKLLWQEEGTAALGTAKRELLRLTEIPGARRVRRTTGLYHTAFLVPNRWELAHLVRQIAETRTTIEGTSNHGTHLAIYLPDPEGNGIELAWDFPKEAWPMKDGKLNLSVADRRGVDMDELIEELHRDPTPWTELAPDTQVGHVHLHVSDIETSRQFYHEVLGFDITAELRDFGAAFFSAGGYHHHVAVNTWNGAGAPPPPQDAQGLRYFTIELPTPEDLNQVVQRVQAAGSPVEQVAEGVLARDPSGNGVLLAAHPG